MVYVSLKNVQKSILELPWVDVLLQPNIGQFSVSIVPERFVNINFLPTYQSELKDPGYKVNITFTQCKSKGQPCTYCFKSYFMLKFLAFHSFEIAFNLRKKGQTGSLVSYCIMLKRRQQCKKRENRRLSKRTANATFAIPNQMVASYWFIFVW